MITTGKKKIQSSVGGKFAVFLLWREIFITTGKKKYITTGKKRYSRLSVGCAVLAITTGKKKRYSRLAEPEKKKIQSSVCWVRGSGDYYRKKKVPVICLAGCAVVSAFGSGDYDQKKIKFQSSLNLY